MTLNFPRMHLTGEVDKSVRCSCEFYSGFNISKLLKSLIFGNKKVGQFLEHSVNDSCFFSTEL